MNTVKFIQLYKIYGWPDVSLVGEKANKVAWLLIQHSDIETQIRFLPIIKKSCEKGETFWKYYAYIHDRIISKRKGKVKYGTSMYYDENTGYMTVIAENPNCINYYREQVGLKPSNAYRVYEPCE